MASRKDFMETLYRESSGRIFDFLYKYTGNQEVASDLMQDTFLNFFKKYSDSDLNKEQSLKLLYTIARNRSINHAKKFSTVKESGSDDMGHYKEEGQSFVRKTELSDLETRLMECLGDLEEGERYALVLKNIENYTLSDIAEVMDISVATASRLVVKATAKLLEIAKSKQILPM
ncbi:sigma-70 family RNA polymerase sigma factor [Leptospira langatensis]|uniref:Sigma-70 family RNA polymerase sigma factor n=1 Tax=Leptospira langatensis TaxID=2484983 RepID=A0A5F1ZS04_9LEPT|nr:sigma-70 family RNA polymerase sigma factor [Leptospira langatensis]TGK01932.1 sigma-70 family RNA polymerase sigma factor [Leptospira langatensis]TGL39287.1 sigma-70 family RNA polymerase sigma factor [Leptospira langatensis]